MYVYYFYLIKKNNGNVWSQTLNSHFTDETITIRLSRVIRDFDQKKKKESFVTML